MVCRVVAAVALLLTVCSATTYNVVLLEAPTRPVLSFVDGSSTYEQVFNPRCGKSQEEEKSGRQVQCVL